MKKYIFLLSFFVFSYLFSQNSEKKDTSGADFDGPHIFYKENSTIIKQVIKENGIFVAKIDSFPSKIEKISCNVDENQSFSVKIKEKHQNEPSYYPQPKKLIAISDIEGNYEPLKNFLINNKVMDKNFNWTFGKGHLVLNGDFFDRGLWVTQSLWLIYKLEAQAEKAGGKVHFIIGNHEIMSFYGNAKYLRNKYLETSKLMGENHPDFYSPQTELGRWFQSKNVVEKIGDYLFLHAGMSPEVAELGLSLEEINNLSRPHYFNGYQVRKLGDKTLEILFSNKVSPFWYRGWAKQTTEKELLPKILHQFGVKKMVFGHSVVPEISYFYDKQLIDIDTDHAKGKTQGLFIKNGKEYRVDIHGKKTRMK